MNSSRQESSSLSEIEFLRRENERLNEVISSLNRNYQELMFGQSDDAMVALLKKIINDKDKYIEETEKHYEEQIHKLKQETHSLQRESSTLRAANGQLETMLRQLNEGGSGAVDPRVEILQRRIEELEETLRREYAEKMDMENQLAYAKDQLNNETDSRPSVLMDNTGRKILRKRQNGRPSSSQSRKEKNEPIEPKHFVNLQGDEELKRMLTQSVEEKARLEKVNKELSNKIMLMMKNYDEEKAKEIAKERKKAEYGLLATKRELEDIKRIKEENESKLLGEILKLQKQITEGKVQLQVYGSGIETLTKELQLREDPSHSATQVVKYLEKYAKFQNEFMSNEVKRFQEDFSQLKEDVKKRENEAEHTRKKQVDMMARYEGLRSEFEMMSEISKLRAEEVLALKQENNALVISLELLRKDKTQLSNLKKANSELVYWNNFRETS